MLIGITAANLRMDNLMGTTEVVVGSVLALVGVVSIFTTVSRQPESSGRVEEVITCRKLNVVNAKGNLVACLYAGEYGGIVRVNDEVERSVAGIGAVEQGGKVGILDETGQDVAVLCDGENGGNLFIWDKVGNPAVGLNVTNHGGVVSVTDKTGNLAVGLGASANGGTVAIHDEKGNITTTFS